MLSCRIQELSLEQLQNSALHIWICHFPPGCESWEKENFIFIYDRICEWKLHKGWRKITSEMFYLKVSEFLHHWTWVFNIFSQSLCIMIQAANMQCSCLNDCEHFKPWGSCRLFLWNNKSICKSSALSNLLLCLKGRAWISQCSWTGD